MLVVHPSVPATDIKSFVAYARQQQGKLKHGAGGVGTLTHLLMEQLKSAAGFDAVTAQYRGIGPAFQDLLGGQVEVLTPGAAAALPHIRSGKVKPLAVTGLARHPLLPDVPTFEESGFKGFDGLQWYGIVGPAKLNPEATKRLSAEINKALALPALKERLVAEAIEPMPMTPGEFGAYIEAELARYTRLARERKIWLEEK
jgi:tripartite-type tricarboxylate transporter receptor subunit TctC